MTVERKPKAGDKYKAKMAEKIGMEVHELYPEMADEKEVDSTVMEKPVDGSITPKSSPLAPPPPKRSKEEEKRAVARAQIHANQGTAISRRAYNGNYIISSEVFPIAPYSTKFMSTDDQFTLAVDKVAFPEFKVALIPAAVDDSHYLRRGCTFWDYASLLSLNDGDKVALAHLLSAFKDGQHRSFIYNNPDGEDVEFIAYMYSGTAKLIQFNFDMYHGDIFSGIDGIPGITASFILRPREEDNPYEEYTSKLEWNYVLTIHRNDPDTPRDSDLKPEYELFQRILRAVIVNLGILPSKLDLENAPERSNHSTEFVDIGAAIQLK